MCDYSDEMWDGKAGWQKYVDARVLEITCGEAPFLVSRYDAETGEAIPISDRIGLLDRKLRAVNENAQTEEEWMKWTFRAFWATYGYEFQGDNLLIARVNLLMTFEEYLLNRWKRKPTLVKIVGRKNGERKVFYTKKEYLNDPGNLHTWKVLIAGAIGTGTFGETLSEPIVTGPESAHTQTFVSMGEFETEEEANALSKYLKTKFARALLGIMKTTQNNQSKIVWSNTIP